MTLLTPPSTVLRVLVDKENIPDNVFDDVHGGSRVVWSQKNSYHSLSSLPSASASSTKSNKFLPTKSILKPHVQSSIFLLPFPAEPEPRQVTPEPADPLTDLNYLVYPLSQIVKHASDVSMRELIEAYNVLAARLRTSVVGKHDIDASWPLFEPLRKNRKAFVYALVRDLGRALINPASGDDAENMPRVLLPSPKGTPKKKGGMTAEQVKYARDLCTTCHSVIRLLALVFTLPALRNLFSGMWLQFHSIYFQRCSTFYIGQLYCDYDLTAPFLVLTNFLPSRRAQFHFHCPPCHTHCRRPPDTECAQNMRPGYLAPPMPTPALHRASSCQRPHCHCPKTRHRRRAGQRREEGVHQRWTQGQRHHNTAHIVH